MNCISSFPDAECIAERLAKKDVTVNIYGVKHEGKPSAKIVAEYGKADLRTVELQFGSIGYYIDPELRKKTEASEDITMIGLGSNPKYGLDIVGNVLAAEFEEWGGYWIAFAKAYPDMRGVDHWYGGVELQVGIAERRVRLPFHEYPTLTTNQSGIITSDLFRYAICTKRDEIQAYMIAKALDLFTYNRDRAVLNHAGGLMHLALPEILRSFGINTQVVYADDASPEPRWVAMANILPPRVILALTTIQRTPAQVNIQPEVFAKLDKKIAQLKPHLPVHHHVF
jgi:hypothetical protein